jgi:hypothetical protein
MKTSQYERIGKLLTRKTGATAMDIASVAGTVSPHSRLAEMKARGLADLARGNRWAGLWQVLRQGAASVRTSRSA